MLSRSTNRCPSDARTVTPVAPMLLLVEKTYDETARHMSTAAERPEIVAPRLVSIHTTLATIRTSETEGYQGVEAYCAKYERTAVAPPELPPGVVEGTVPAQLRSTSSVTDVALLPDDGF